MAESRTRTEFRRDAAVAICNTLVAGYLATKYPVSTQTAALAAALAIELTLRLKPEEDKDAGEIPSSDKDRDHGPTQEDSPAALDARLPPS